MEESRLCVISPSEVVGAGQLGPAEDKGESKAPRAGEPGQSRVFARRARELKNVSQALGFAQSWSQEEPRGL